MKVYMKPAIAEVELFTQDEISLVVPKTVYRRTAAGAAFKDNDAELIAYALREGENLSGINRTYGTINY